MAGVNNENIGGTTSSWLIASLATAGYDMVDEMTTRLINTSTWPNGIFGTVRLVPSLILIADDDNNNNNNNNNNNSNSNNNNNDNMCQPKVSACLNNTTVLG